MSVREETISNQISRGVVTHIILYDLLRRQEFRDVLLTRVEPGRFEELAGIRTRDLWEMVVAGAKA